VSDLFGIFPNQFSRRVDVGGSDFFIEIVASGDPRNDVEANVRVLVQKLFEGAQNLAASFAEKMVSDKLKDERVSQRLFIEGGDLCLLIRFMHNDFTEDIFRVPRVQGEIVLFDGHRTMGDSDNFPAGILY